MALYNSVSEPSLVQFQNKFNGHKYYSDPLVIEEVSKELEIHLELYHITSTEGGAKISLFKNVNIGAKKIVPLLTNPDNLNAYGLIRVDKRGKKLLLLEKYRCNTCSLWRQKVGFLDHIKKCIKCGCGACYYEGDTHGITCHGLSISEKTESTKHPEISKKYKKSKDNQINLGKCLFADLETFVPPGHREFIAYSAALHTPKSPDDQVHVWSGQDCLKNFFLELQFWDGILWFHNGGRFDCYFLIKYCFENNITIDETSLLMRGKTIISFRIITLKGEIVLKDMCRFTPGKLSKLCQAYKVDKKFCKGDFDHRLIRTWEDVVKYKTQFEEYVKLDVMAMRQVFLKYSEVVWNDHHLHACQFMTASHLAYAAWNSKLPLKTKNKLKKVATEDEEKVRALTRGGRITVGRQKWESTSFSEVFEKKEIYVNKQGEKSHRISREVYDSIKDFQVYLDVNSLYPAVMANQKYPIGNYRIIIPSQMQKQIMIEQLNRNTKESKEFWRRTAAQISVTPPDNLMIPFLMERIDGVVEQTLFPKVETWYTGPEIREAVKQGYKITDIHNYIEWEFAEEIFTEYILNAYKAKSNSPKDTPIYTCNKSAMNDLSGKFAQKGSKEIIHIIRDIDALNGKKISQMTRIDNMEGDPLVWIAKEPTTSDYSDYPIQLNSFILGKSKVLMARILRKANLLTEEEEGVVYQDTDSYIIHNNSFQKIPPKYIATEKLELGALKKELEGKIIKVLCIAPKTYMIVFINHETLEIQAKIRCKGIPHISIDYPAFTIQTQEDISHTLKLFNRAALNKNEDYVDIQYRCYRFKDQDGNIEYLSRIPSQYFEDVLFGRKILDVVYGSMIKSFEYNSTEGINIQPTIVSRKLVSEPWWSKKKRIILNTPGTAYPPGHFRLNAEKKGTDLFIQ